MKGKITLQDVNSYSDLGSGGLIGSIGQIDTTLEDSAGALNLQNCQLTIVGNIKIASTTPSQTHRSLEASGGVVGISEW